MIYFGGKLVYESGAGLEPEHGVYKSDTPALGGRNAGAFFKAAATDLVRGVQCMAEAVSAGKVVPTLTAKFPKDGESVAPTKPALSM